MRKFNRKPPVSLPSGAVFQLVCGQDFFGDAWGSRPDEQTIAAMRTAWRDKAVRAAVHERARAYGPSVRPFAFHLFGTDGRSNRPLTAADVKAARDAHRRERTGVV